LVIFDEMQKIKNSKVLTTRAAYTVESDRRWGLTGTPLENRAEEFVVISLILARDFLEKEELNDPFVVRDKMTPYFLRRKKEDVLPDLPPKVHQETWLELTSEQREAYEEAEYEGIIELQKMIRDEELRAFQRIQHILALITKLKQICNFDPVNLTSAKAEFLIEKLEDIVASGEKALIFSQYPEKTLRHLESKLTEFSPLVYTGSLSDRERDIVVKNFQEQEKSKVLLMSVRAGGLGLTLTRANHVFHFDLWWNPAVAAQAEDRAHRIGQNKTVFVNTLLTKDTIEEKIHKLLESKKLLFKVFVDDLSDRNLQNLLSEEELLSLFGLNAPQHA